MRSQIELIRFFFYKLLQKYYLKHSGLEGKNSVWEAYFNFECGITL